VRELISVFEGAWQYALLHLVELRQAVGVHLTLVGIALGIGIVVCVPLGILTARKRWASITIMNTINTLRVIPSLAVLFLVLPYLGLNTTSATVALTILALPPILINTDAAFRNLDPAIIEAAQGMGMTPAQILWRVEFPLAMPVILTGVRTAAVEVISSATLAAFVGSGGLGIYITRGFALYDFSILMVGAVPVALLALLSEFLLGRMQRLFYTPVQSTGL